MMVSKFDLISFLTESMSKHWPLDAVELVGSHHPIIRHFSDIEICIHHFDVATTIGLEDSYIFGIQSNHLRASEI
jgi:hypothetical protein